MDWPELLDHPFWAQVKEEEEEEEEEEEGWSEDGEEEERDEGDGDGPDGDDAISSRFVVALWIDIIRYRLQLYTE